LLLVTVPRVWWFSDPRCEARLETEVFAATGPVSSATPQKIGLLLANLLDSLCIFPNLFERGLSQLRRQG